MSNKDRDWLHNAFKVAKEHDANGKYNMVALAVRGNRILAVGKNDYIKKGAAKHPGYEYKSIHAELDAIVELLRNHPDEKNVTLYVGGWARSDRVNKKTSPMNNTKPCPVCERLISETPQIRKVVFVENGEPKKVVVR